MRTLAIRRGSVVLRWIETDADQLPRRVRQNDQIKVILPNGEKWLVTVDFSEPASKGKVVLWKREPA
jgi:hypothetical protein